MKILVIQGSGKPEIDKTGHLQEAYEFGKNLYGGDSHAEM